MDLKTHIYANKATIGYEAYIIEKYITNLTILHTHIAKLTQQSFYLKNVCKNSFCDKYFAKFLIRKASA